MHKNIYFKLIILFLFFSALPMAAQSLKEMEEEAYNALNNEDYDAAYIKFEQLNFKNPDDYDYKLNLGICCLKIPEKKERAIQVFLEMKKTDSTIIELDYYLGNAYHVNYKFDEAIETLQRFVTGLSESKTKDDKEMVSDAIFVLNNCKNGKILIENKVIADIVNIGAPINTEEEQYVPVITTDESILYFTYTGVHSVGGKLNSNLQPDPINGKYNEDIYIAFKRPDGVYSEPIGLDSINTNGHEAAIAISPDGQTLFTFYSNTKNSGDIAMSKLVGDEFSKPKVLNKHINTEAWEGSCSISADGRYLYFASDRPGGIGGRDIWVSEHVRGDWGPAKNMGPNINTPFDDDAPFIHPDGITLFFSSKGHQSIGGYDIMFSIKKENEWTKPNSMGLPLNTTEDDRYYVINSKGDRGYFSSNRPFKDGKGKNDIYTVTPGILGDKPIVALIKGVVYGNGQPIEAKLELIKTVKKDQFSTEELEMLSNNELTNDGKLIIANFSSNSSTGKYLTTLKPGNKYIIRVTADTYNTVEKEFDFRKLTEYEEITKDYYLVTQTLAVGPPTIEVVTPTLIVEPTPTVEVVTTQTTEVATPTVEATTTVATANTPCSDKTLPDFTPLKGKSLNDINYYKEMLSMVGDYCAEGLVFKVQIGAYRKPENFKYPNLQGFGKAEVVNYPDGITRFTQNELKTINEAEVQRQKAIAKGQTDAWIVAFIDGKRYTLEDLIMLDFLGKTIN